MTPQGTPATHAVVGPRYLDTSVSRWGPCDESLASAHEQLQDR